jgi:hypothetical protein
VLRSLRRADAEVDPRNEVVNHALTVAHLGGQPNQCGRSGLPGQLGVTVSLQSLGPVCHFDRRRDQPAFHLGEFQRGQALVFGGARQRRIEVGCQPLRLFSS